MVLENDQIKVADFGIARIDASEFTIVGDLLGTPAYMAPEQFAGAPVDQRTDLFAAGVILFEMLTAVKPFRGKSITEILCLMEKRGPEDIGLLNPAVPEALKQVIGKALAFDPAARYASAAAFATAIAEASVAPSGQGPPTEVSRAEEEQRAEAVRQAAEEKQRAEAARRAAGEKQRAEAARRAAEEKQRAEAARRAAEEKQRAEAARQAAEEKQRAEAARQAAEEKQRVEAARQAAEEKQRVEAARQAAEEKRRVAVALPRHEGVSTGLLWLETPWTVWNIARQTRQYLVAKAGRRVIVSTAAAGVCMALVTGILLYSGVSSPTGLKAGLSDRPTIQELPDLEIAPSPPQTAPIPPRTAPTAPPQTALTAPPQAAPTAPPQTALTAPPQAASTAPPQTALTGPSQAAPTGLPQTAPTGSPETTKKSLNPEKPHRNKARQIAKGQHHPTQTPALIPDWGLSNDPPPSER